MGDKKKADVIMIEKYKPLMAERLRKCRKGLKKTQEEICARLGLSRQALSDYENGKAIPQPETFMRMSLLYGESINYLLGISDYSSQEIEDLGKPLKLSDTAIKNILYEGSEAGNNQRVCALDWLLSDRKTFTALMDELLALIYPMTYYLPPNVWKKTGWVTVREDNSVEVNPSFLRYVSDKNPDNIYQRIRNVLDDFISKLNEKGIKYVAPNEFNPFMLSDIEEESERLEELRQKAQEEIKQKKRR